MSTPYNAVKLVLFLTFALFLYDAALSAPPRPEYPCYNVSGEKVQIDGKLDEDFWAETPAVELRDMKTGEKIPYPSKVKLVWDNDYLYAGYSVDCVDVFGRDLDMERGNPDEFEKHWNEISQLMFVKLFLDPDGDGNDIFEMHIHPGNWVLHYRMQIPNHNQNYGSGIGVSWDGSGLKSAVFVDGTLNDDSDVDRGMTVELAVPWAAIKKYTVGNCPPKPGDRWAASPQFRYFIQPVDEKKREARYASWPALGMIDSHVYDKYGWLVFSARKPGTLQWKMVWAWALPSKTDEEIEEGVRQAKSLGFNAMAWDANWRPFIHACRKHGVESYATISLAWDKHYHAQQMLPGEEKLPSNSNEKPDFQHGGEPVDGTGKEIHSNNFPCFRHPYVVEQFRAKIRQAVNRGYTGIAFDWIGYKNYHGCYCDLCRRLMKQNAPPGMPAQEAVNRFQEETLVNLYEELSHYARAYAASISRTVKTTGHIYPVFMPDILYGNRLPVDYCGQTVSWFFKPHWGFDKIERYTRYVVENESCRHEQSIGAPFIGFYSTGDMAGHVKSPDRVRKEIQIIKKCGARAIQFAELGNILAAPEVARVVAEELGDK